MMHTHFDRTLTKLIDNADALFAKKDYFAARKSYQLVHLQLNAHPISIKEWGTRQSNDILTEWKNKTFFEVYANIQIFLCEINEYQISPLIAKAHINTILTLLPQFYACFNMECPESLYQRLVKKDSQFENKIFLASYWFNYGLEQEMSTDEMGHHVSDFQLTPQVYEKNMLAVIESFQQARKIYEQHACEQEIEDTRQEILNRYDKLGDYFLELTDDYFTLAREEDSQSDKANIVAHLQKAQRYYQLYIDLSHQYHKPIDFKFYLSVLYVYERLSEIENTNEYVQQISHYIAQHNLAQKVKEIVDVTYRKANEYELNCYLKKITNIKDTQVGVDIRIMPKSFSSKNIDSSGMKIKNNDREYFFKETRRVGKALYSAIRAQNMQEISQNLNQLEQRFVLAKDLNLTNVFRRCINFHYGEHDDETLLIRAVREKNIPVVKQLLDWGASQCRNKLFDKTGEGRLAIHYAIDYDDAKLAELLLSYPSFYENNYWQIKRRGIFQGLLHYAAEVNALEVAKVLTKEPSLIHEWNHINELAIDSAVIYLRPDMVRLFFQRGMRITHKDELLRKLAKAAEFYHSEKRAKEIEQLITEAYQRQQQEDLSAAKLVDPAISGEMQQLADQPTINAEEKLPKEADSTQMVAHKISYPSSWDSLVAECKELQTEQAQTELANIFAVRDRPYANIYYFDQVLNLYPGILPAIKKIYPHEFKLLSLIRRLQDLSIPITIQQVSDLIIKEYPDYYINHQSWQELQLSLRAKFSQFIGISAVWNAIFSPNNQANQTSNINEKNIVKTKKRDTHELSDTKVKVKRMKKSRKKLHLPPVNESLVTKEMVEICREFFMEHCLGHHNYLNKKSFEKIYLLNEESYLSTILVFHPPNHCPVSERENYGKKLLAELWNSFSYRSNSKQNMLLIDAKKSYFYQDTCYFGAKNQRKEAKTVTPALADQLGTVVVRFTTSQVLARDILVHYGPRFGIAFNALLPEYKMGNETEEADTEMDYSPVTPIEPSILDLPESFATSNPMVISDSDDEDIKLLKRQLADLEKEAEIAQEEIQKKRQQEMEQKVLEQEINQSIIAIRQIGLENAAVYDNMKTVLSKLAEPNEPSILFRMGYQTIPELSVFLLGDEAIAELKEKSVQLERMQAEWRNQLSKNEKILHDLQIKLAEVERNKREKLDKKKETLQRQIAMKQEQVNKLKYGESNQLSPRQKPLSLSDPITLFGKTREKGKETVSPVSTNEQNLLKNQRK